MAYWWEGDPAERYWVEIRKVEGIGRSLRCPAPPVDGSLHNAWYRLVGRVRPGDVVYHWHAVEHRFVGHSRAVSSARTAGDDWVVDLADFTLLSTPTDRERLKQLTPEVVAIRDRLLAVHGHPLHLPFQYRRDGLRMMSNYFAKLPADAVALLFAEPDVGVPTRPAGPTADWSSDGGARFLPGAGFLAPFKPKGDTDYLTRLPGGVQRRGRSHETLVNAFGKWLRDQGFDIGRNAAVDLGLSSPPVVVEAKVVTTWPDAIRAAVGQLYEYRYFKVADPKSKLVFLASRPVPDHWLRYLEHDRGIGAAWPAGSGFVLSRLASRALGLHEGARLDRPRGQRTRTAAARL